MQDFCVVLVQKVPFSYSYSISSLVAMLLLVIVLANESVLVNVC